jgi:hypothetical protein
MTLDTSIRILKPTDVKEIFFFCRELLGCTDAHTWKENDNWCGNRCIRNDGMQGLPAWLIVTYGADGPLNCLQCEYAKDEDEDHHNGPCQDAAIDISFDTGYRYRSANGATASDLHDWLVTQIGRWCDERSLPWIWQNEYTGEWHSEYEGISDLGDHVLGAL